MCKKSFWSRLFDNKTPHQKKDHRLCLTVEQLHEFAKFCQKDLANTPSSAIQHHLMHNIGFGDYPETIQLANSLHVYAQDAENNELKIKNSSFMCKKSFWSRVFDNKTPHQRNDHRLCLTVEQLHEFAKFCQKDLANTPRMGIQHHLMHNLEFGDCLETLQLADSLNEYAQDAEKAEGAR